MAASISPSAGTQSIQSSAVQMRTQVPTGSAPTSAPTTPRSRAETNVDILFQLTASLSAALSSQLNNAEANRIQGGEGTDPTLVINSLTEMKEKIEAFQARAPTFGQITEQLSAEVDQAIRSGRGSNERIAEAVQRIQKEMAERYGYVGHIVDLTA